MLQSSTFHSESCSFALLPWQQNKRGGGEVNKAWNEHLLHHQEVTNFTISIASTLTQKKITFNCMIVRRKHIVSTIELEAFFTCKFEIISHAKVNSIQSISNELKMSKWLSSSLLSLTFSGFNFLLQSLDTSFVMVRVIKSRWKSIESKFIRYCYVYVRVPHKVFSWDLWLQVLKLQCRGGGGTHK